MSRRRVRVRESRVRTRTARRDRRPGRRPAIASTMLTPLHLKVSPPFLPCRGFPLALQPPTAGAPRVACTRQMPVRLAPRHRAAQRLAGRAARGPSLPGTLDRLCVALHLRVQLIEERSDTGVAHLLYEPGDEPLDQHQPLSRRQGSRPLDETANGESVKPRIERALLRINGRHMASLNTCLLAPDTMVHHVSPHSFSRDGCWQRTTARVPRVTLELDLGRDHSRDGAGDAAGFRIPTDVIAAPEASRRHDTDLRSKDASDMQQWLGQAPVPHDTNPGRSAYAAVRTTSLDMSFPSSRDRTCRTIPI